MSDPNKQVVVVILASGAQVKLLTYSERSELEEKFARVGSGEKWRICLTGLDDLGTEMPHYFANDQVAFVAMQNFSQRMVQPVNLGITQQPSH